MGNAVSSQGEALLLIVPAPGLASVLQSLYEASHVVFRQLLDSELSVDGYFPLGSEQAVGALYPDPKRYIEFRDGVHLPEPLLSSARNLYQSLLMISAKQKHSVARSVAPSWSQKLIALIDEAPPPVLRITHYPYQHARKIANYPHTDIDLVTLLPRATAAGLQIFVGERWQDVDFDAESILILRGEMLELFGGPAADVHRVVGDCERYSVSFFINANHVARLPDGRLTGAVLDERLNAVRVSV